jgi:hypothetical protein
VRLDCRDWGAATVKPKPNPAPSRTGLDPGLAEDRRERGKLDWHPEEPAAPAKPQRLQLHRPCEVRKSFNSMPDAGGLVRDKLCLRLAI